MFCYHAIEWKYTGTCMFLCLHYKIYMKAQKHACFHVFSPFSACLSPHYIIMVKGLLLSV